jgi:predicted HTH domain antitoxin
MAARQTARARTDPDQIAQDLGAEGDIPRRILEATALEGYRDGRLSRGQVSEMQGLGFSDTEAFLKRHHALLHYSLADLEADRATRDRILTAE